MILVSKDIFDSIHKEITVQGLADTRKWVRNAGTFSWSGSSEDYGGGVLSQDVVTFFILRDQDSNPFRCILIQCS